MTRSSVGGGEERTPTQHRHLKRKRGLRRIQASEIYTTPGNEP